MQQTDRPPASGQPAADWPVSKKPFAYELPQDVEAVAALAGGLAYYVATAEYPQQEPFEELLRLAQEYLESLASSAGSFLWESALTNDREAFQALFAECFVQMYYQVLDTWVREPQTAQRVKHLLGTLSPEELLAYTQQRAKEALSAVVGGITHQGQGSPAPLAPPGHVLALARVLRLFSTGLGKSVTSEQVFGPAAKIWAKKARM
jgi:hypothetical protein